VFLARPLGGVELHEVVVAVVRQAVVESVLLTLAHHSDGEVLCLARHDEDEGGGDCCGGIGCGGHMRGGR